MKGLKCTVFLTLFVLCVPLLLISSDVNAKRYNILAIPITSDESVSTFGGGIQNVPFSIIWNDFSGVNGPNFRPNINVKDTARFFNSSNNESLNICKYNGHRGNGVEYSNGVLSWQIGSYLNFYQGQSIDFNYFNIAKCQQATEFGAVGYGNIPHPDFDEDSFYGLTPITTGFYKSLLPYYYDFSHIYLSDDAVDYDGVHYKASLKMSDVTNGEIVSKFSNLTIPLGTAQTNITGDMTEGRQIEFDGVFQFPGASMSNPSSFSWSPIFLERGHFWLTVKGFTSEDDSEPFTTNIDCNLTTRQIQDSSLGIDEIQIQYTCPYTFEKTFLDDNVYFNLNIGMPYDTPQPNEREQWYVFSTNSDWVYTTAFVITDNDPTPASEPWNRAPTGNNLKEAPGSAIPAMEQGSASDADWFSSLVNLFGFSFINPFAPIFNLFADQSSCAQIPTIANMINAEETQVCPWFSSSTRNIATPVLGLASIMLVFGFVVRWLGARSGNLFEDSVDTGSYSFSNKFRRK